MLGYYPVQVTSAILDKISDLEIGILIVNLIFNLVKSALIIISIMIIYTLLMLSIEQKNFEVAVIRMVGLKELGIIGLVICQAFLYVLPAMGLAFASCIGILTYASPILEA